MPQLHLSKSIVDLGIRASRSGALDEERPQPCPLAELFEMELDQLGRRARFDERIRESFEILSQTGLDCLHEQDCLVGKVPVDGTRRQPRRACRSWTVTAA